MFWSVCNSLTREELLSPGAVCRAVCLQLEIERERRIVQPAYSQRCCTRECKKQTWLSRTWLDTCWYLQTQKIYCMDRRRISWVSSACICFCCALSPILVHFDLSSMWKKRKRQTEKRNKRKEAALEGIMGHRLSVDEAPTNSCFASKPFLSSHSSPPWMDPSSFDRTATDRDDATKSRILLWQIHSIPLAWV